ncbi:excinuclease ABC subunit C [Spiroplasma corruscae]|uniref:UvrABC system protein C n=1 Tax=Spiroplasma corruscae TaxID=216934 RepID=A0A222EPX2_9MOLU|nr:excinuclease ABC subunit UvrC [Spiroplasma corruscae]ASP28605.1 excinuclease ABC subunit C [Spiroplasma corruscae]
MIDKIKSIPDKPGCYIYFNENKKVIYVGKAKNLKKRVSSYFNKAHNFKTTKLVREVRDLETIITANEKEALILEQNLIKKYKPRFNVILNDDKKYPYIAITDEKDPTYIFTRNYDAKNKISFGPLPDGSSARNILRTLERIYPLRRCKGNLGKPCINFFIEQCSGACFKEVDPNYYVNQINNVKKVFYQGGEEFKKILKDKMIKASDNLQFEEAQRIKEIINNLGFTTEDQYVDFGEAFNKDIYGYYFEENYISFAVLFYRSGKLISKDSMVFESDVDNVQELFESFVMQVYQKNMIPDLIILPSNFVLGGLSLFFGTKISKKYDEISNNLLGLAKENAKEFLIEKIKYKSQKSIIYEELLNSLQSLLNLPRFPYHIEMFDVANILDEYVTGAMVVFKNGLPSFNDFRKFNINIDNQDDYHRMQNMVYRRYQKDLNKPENLPDLIIMDGGKIQVNAANSQLDLLDIHIPVIGLVKNQKHKTEYIFNYNKEEIYIDKTSEVFLFLEKIQDRVHRFAISGFRNRKLKGTIKDELMDVAGVGPKLISKINERYSNRQDFYDLSEKDLLKVVNNKTTCKNLLNFIKNKKN